MLRTTDRQLENLMFLRDVVIPWMKKHPELINLDVYGAHNCTTPGCLLGWYTQLRHGQQTLHWAGLCDLGDRLVEEFGHDIHTVNLFGLASAGTLDQRLSMLERHIERRLEQLEAYA